MSDRIKSSWAKKSGIAPTADHAMVNRWSVPACRKWMAGRWRLRLGLYGLLIMLLVVVGLAPTVAGSSVLSAAVGTKESAARVYRIKAAFLYNFAKFTKWPSTAFSTPRSALHLCVLNDGSFGDALQTIEGRGVGARALRVRQVDRETAVENCHLLFIGESEADHVRQILDALDDAPVLTISDIAGFATIGGVIQLKTTQNKIRFEINQVVAERLGLKLSSKLLRLAEIVGDRPERGLSGAREQ